MPPFVLLGPGAPRFGIADINNLETCAWSIKRKALSLWNDQRPESEGRNTAFDLEECTGSLALELKQLSCKMKTRITSTGAEMEAWGDSYLTHKEASWVMCQPTWLNSVESVVRNFQTSPETAGKALSGLISRQKYYHHQLNRPESELKTVAMGSGSEIEKEREELDSTSRTSKLPIRCYNSRAVLQRICVTGENEATEQGERMEDAIKASLQSQQESDKQPAEESHGVSLRKPNENLQKQFAILQLENKQLRRQAAEQDAQAKLYKDKIRDLKKKVRSLNSELSKAKSEKESEKKFKDVQKRFDLLKDSKRKIEEDLNKLKLKTYRLENSGFDMSSGSAASNAVTQVESSQNFRPPPVMLQVSQEAPRQVPGRKRGRDEMRGSSYTGAGQSNNTSPTRRTKSTLPTKIVDCARCGFHQVFRRSEIPNHERWTLVNG